MKKINYIIFLFIIIFAACNESKHNDEIYFGQTPPGDTARLFAPNLVSTGVHEMNICISNDLKNIFVGTSSINWNSGIVLYHLGSNGWEQPELPAFTKGLNDNYPFLTPDNKRIYFNTSRDEKRRLAGRGIWYAEYVNGTWGEAKQLDLNSEPDLHLTFPSIAKSGNIYFNTTTNDGYGKSDIYMIHKTADGYSKPVNLGEAINTPFYEFHPYISPYEDFIIFDAIREDGYGRNDLYISYKDNNGEWTKAINMGPKVNTPYSDMRPYLSPDGKYLFFCSNRSDIKDKIQSKKLNYNEFKSIVNGPGNGSQDIYWIDAKIIQDLKPKNL